MQTLEDHPLFRPVMIGLLFLIGVGLLVYLLFSLAQDLSLWLLGEHTAAVVVDRWAEPVGDRSQEELSFRYYVRYRFAAANGEVVESTKAVAVQEWVGVGFGARASNKPDFYDGSAQGPAAPVYREQEHLTEFNAGGVTTGEMLDVVYFPLYPAHNRLEETRFIPFLACLYVPLLLLAASALAAARHLLRTHRAEVPAHNLRWNTASSESRAAGHAME